MLEIERKFLVTSRAYREQASYTEPIIQGFLNTHPERTVRVRVMGNSACLTVKGKSNDSGSTRFEWETEIEAVAARELLELCEKPLMQKTRYHVHLGKHIFEVDEFEGENAGLVVAEIELESEDEDFQRPTWLGSEVTGDHRYYNSKLVKKPYTQWEQ